MKRFRTYYKYWIFSLILLSLNFLLSCQKKGADKESSEADSFFQEVEIKKSNHKWYYFSNDNFIQTDRIHNVPAAPSIPWTEAVRISSANCCTDFSSNGNGSTDGGDAFAIINRLGILCFNNDRISLAKDINLFSDRTAGNLVFLNNTPLFSVYKSAFFNDSITTPDYKSDESQHLFVLQFDPASKIAYPIVNCNNILAEKNSEVTDFIWDGLNWLCSVKSLSDSKSSFSYISWKPTVPLLSLSPSNARNSISVKEISVQDFRNAKLQSDFVNAPERIKQLLAGFSDKKSFNIEIKTAGGVSPRTYLNTVNSYSEKELSAKAIIAESWSGVLFEDGTFFIEGALPSKHILRNGKPVAIRLPKLPGGFIYSDFVISGTTLYAAWEEADFYTTKRAGFVSINLENTLYSKLL